MGYAEATMSANENVLFRARIHPAVFLPAAASFLGCILFAFIATSPFVPLNPSVLSLADMFLCLAGISFFCSIGLGFQALLVILTTDVIVTDQRVVAQTGFIRRYTQEVPLAQVESVSVQQHRLGRMLNYGTVTVTGADGTQENFRAIVEPLKFRSKITSLLEQHTSPDQYYPFTLPRAVE